jgi:DNA-binding XRE family transcriptional regulator
MTVKPMGKSELPYYPDRADPRSSGSIRCELCGRVLAGRAGYVTHHKQCHAGQTPSWSYTTATPDNPHNLPYSHSIMAKGTKVCKLCGHRVGSRPGLQKHFASHHAGISPKDNFYVVAIVKIDGGNVTIKQFAPRKKPAKSATLQQLRGLCGLSQIAAAKKLGVLLGRDIPYQTLQRWESGESSNPTLEMIAALAGVYDVSEAKIIAAFRATAQITQSVTTPRPPA